MKKWIREQSLSVVLFALFLIFWAAQSVTGYLSYNQDQQEHGGQQVNYMHYLKTGHFIEGTFENWESEYLQMSAYVVLTAFLVQKGAADSNKPKTEEDGQGGVFMAGRAPEADRSIADAGAWLAARLASAVAVKA